MTKPMKRLALLQWVCQDLDPKLTQESSRLTETGRYNAGSLKKTTCYNTNKHNEIYLRVTAFETEYLQVRTDSKWSDVFIRPGESMVIVLFLLHQAVSDKLVAWKATAASSL